MTDGTTNGGASILTPGASDQNRTEAPGTTAKVGVVVATPMRKFDKDKPWHPRHEVFLKELAALSVDPGCPFEFWHMVVTGGRTWGRCRVVSAFRKLRVKAPLLKWIYWCDDDVEQAAGGLLRLLGHKQPVVGALYVTQEENCHYVANFMHEVQLQPNGLLQVVELGTGGLLTHYQVYDIIESNFPTLKYTDRNTGEKHFGFFQEVVIEGIPYSEDYFFCRLMRHCKVTNPTNPEEYSVGIGIWADTQMKLRHRGPQDLTYPRNDEWPPVPVDE